MTNATNATNAVNASNVTKEERSMNTITIAQAMAKVNKAMNRGMGPAEAKQYLGMSEQREFNNGSFDGLAVAFCEGRATRSPKPLEQWWARRNEELAASLDAINKALVLHPAIATRHLNPVKFNVISLKQRDGFYTAIETEAQLVRHLKDNPELRNLLERRGKEAKAAEEVRAVWATIPGAYKRKVVEHHNRFVKDLSEEKTVVVNGKAQKASLVRAIAHLSNPDGQAFWAVLGAQFAIRALFNAQYFWAKSAEFWAEAQRPTAPWERYYRNEADRPSPEDTVYDGEELGSYEGPFGVRRLCGRTVREAHSDRLMAMDEMADDYESAASEADEIADALAAALAKHGLEAPYLYKTYDDGRTFVTITDKEEAIAHMVAKDEAYAVRQMVDKAAFAGVNAVKHETRHDLIFEIFQGMTVEERIEVISALSEDDLAKMFEHAPEGYLDQLKAEMEEAA